MSLFDNIEEIDKLKEVKKAIIYNNNLALQTLNQTIKSNWMLLWENPGFSAQQILDELGTDAAQLFKMGYDACVFMETTKPGTLEEKFLSAKLSYIINQDGTITINEV